MKFFSAVEKFFNEHFDTIKTAGIGTGGFGVLLTNWDLGLKCLVGVLTIIYLSVKIWKELKK